VHGEEHLCVYVLGYRAVVSIDALIGAPFVVVVSKERGTYLTCDVLL